MRRKEQENKKEKVNIMELNIPNQAKEILIKIEMAAESIHPTVKSSIPRLLLVGDRGVGNTQFAKILSAIMMENHVFPVRGSETYLELVFPKNGSEMDYDRFFGSPKKVASTQNRFYGVFMISFEEWKGKDLLYNDNFKKLLTYVDNNPQIYYIFQIPSSFEMKEELKRELNNHVNMMEVELELAGYDHATHYIRECLEPDGIVFSPSGAKELRNFIERKMDFAGTAFSGYHSLQQVAMSIRFELMTDKKREPVGKQVSVTSAMMKQIEDKVITPEAVTSGKNKIGFMA